MTDRNLYFDSFGLVVVVRSITLDGGGGGVGGVGVGIRSGEGRGRGFLKGCG